MSQQSLPFQHVIDNPNFNESFSWGREAYQSDKEDKGTITYADILNIIQTELSPQAEQRERVACSYLNTSPTTKEQRLGFVVGFLVAHAEALTALPPTSATPAPSSNVIPLRRRK